MLLSLSLGLTATQLIAGTGAPPPVIDNPGDSGGSGDTGGTGGSGGTDGSGGTGGSGDIVDMSAAAGSLAFPQANTATADTAHALALDQPMTGMPAAMFSAKLPEAALFAIVRLPRETRYHNATWRIADFDGGSTNRVLWMRLYGAAHGSSGVRNKFRGGIDTGSAAPYSAVWDEDAALVVYRRNAAATMVIDWYSLVDGTKHAGAPGSQNRSFTVGTNAAARVGAAVNTDPGDFSGWPGEIEAVGYVEGSVPDEDWSRIALGARLENVLPVTGVKWVRELDGSTGSLAAPSWATADTSDAMTTLWAAPLRGGSDFRRTGETAYLSPDPIPDGKVWGLLPGETARDIALSGAAAGRTGDVEARLIYERTGEVAVDWTSLGAIAGGAFSGTVTVPKSVDGWLVTQFRTTGEPDQITDMRARIGVGYKILQLGQSQTQIYLQSNAIGTATTHPDTGSYVTADEGDMQVALMGPRPRDGLGAFVDQLRAFDPHTPIMVVDAAKNGTGPDQLMDDGQGNRQWSELQAKLDYIGNDISVVSMNWATQGWRSGGASVAETFEALLYGTGTYPGKVDHNLADALRSGFGFALSPATRHQGNVHETVRTEQITYANAAGLTVGPPVSDYRIEDGGGPHPDSTYNGNDQNPNRIFGQRLAIGVARVLGLESGANPHFTGASRSGDTITVTTSATSLSSPGDSGLWFEVDEGGGWITLDTAGASATLSGGDVQITKDGGQGWEAGTKLRFRANGPDRPKDDGAAEDAAIAGALYAPFADDALGLGLPVVGSVTGGNWSNLFETVL